MTITDFLHARMAEERAKARQMTSAIWPKSVQVVPRTDTAALDDDEPEGHVGVSRSSSKPWTRIWKDGTIDSPRHMHPTALEVWSVECGQRRLAELGATLELVDQYERHLRAQERHRKAAAELNAAVEHQEQTGEWPLPGQADVQIRGMRREEDYLTAMGPVLRGLVTAAANVYSDHPDYDPAWRTGNGVPC